jgi:hypothetical protein
MWPFRKQGQSLTEKKPGVRGFLRELGGHWLHFRERWWDAMSGGASVPFAALAVLATTPWGQDALPLWAQTAWAQNVFWAAAVVCAWIAAYRVWKPERNRVIELTSEVAGLTEKLTRADLGVTFDPEHEDGGRFPGRSRSDFVHLRAVVTNLSASRSLHQCFGVFNHIERVDKSEDSAFVERTIVTWALHATSISSTHQNLVRGESQLLNIIEIVPSNDGKF